MKKMKRLMVVATACLLIVIVGCKKDKDENDSVNAIEKNYFSIENGTFVNNDFPAASSAGAPEIGSVFGNTSVLEGGSNPITINTSASVKEILVGIEGKKGYYKIAPSSLKAASQSYLVYLLFSQEFVEDDFSILVAIVNNEGKVSEYETIDVTRVVAGTGKLQVSCSWDKPNDVDLHLIEPNGFEIDWDSESSENGGVLDVDSNPICIMDNINNENITYSGTAKVENGKYVVKISLFSSCDVTEVTNYVVTARLDGNLITPTVGKNPYYGKVEAANAYIDGEGIRGGDIVMEFKVSSQKSAEMATEKMLQFNFPKKQNLAKRSMCNQ